LFVPVHTTRYPRLGVDNGMANAKYLN